jgi:hypothetical protein
MISSIVNVSQTMSVTSERESMELRVCVEKVSSLVKVMANTNRLRCYVSFHKERCP